MMAGAAVLGLSMMRSRMYTDEFRKLHTVICSNHFGGLFTDHDARRVRVAANDLRHDTRIRYAELLHPKDS